MDDTDIIRKRIREDLPAAVFERSPRRLVYFAANFVAFVAALWALEHATSWGAKLVFGIVVGHSVASLGFFAHDLAHGSVLPAGWLRQALQLVCLGANVISPAMWLRVHNRYHHQTVGTYDDPDRRFDLGQATLARRVYSDLFYPSRELPHNPLVLLHFIAYVIKHTVNALGVRTGLMPAPVPFLGRHRRRVLQEVLVILAAQAGLWWWLGSLENVLFGGVLPLAVASVVIMGYVVTNHYPMPLRTDPDVLESTLSVQVPRLLDVLHCNFSYHVEHHLFPGASSLHYPIISRWLAENAPERYRRVPLIEGWQLAFEVPRWAPTAGDDTSSGAVPAAVVTLDGA